MLLIFREIGLSFGMSLVYWSQTVTLHGVTLEMSVILILSLAIFFLLMTWNASPISKQKD